MPRKDLFLFVFLLSQSAPLWAMDLEYNEYPTSSAHTPVQMSPSLSDESKPLIKKFQQRIQQVIQDTETNFHLYKNAPKVLLIGKTGHGKSTVFNLLAGKPFTATKGKLDTNDPVPGSKIGHSKTSTTILPVAQQNSDGVVTWDGAGLGDTAGPEQDIVNKYALGQTCSGTGPSKFLLVASETSLTEKGSDFLQVVNHITDTIPVDQLKDGLALVITKHGSVRDLNVPETIKDMLSENASAPIHLINKDVRDLLSHLTAPENIEARISYVPYPEINGEYKTQEIRDNILKSLRNLKPIENLQLNFQLCPESKTYVFELARTLNADITHFIQNSLHPTIISTCKHQIDAWASQNSATGKSNLTELQENLEALRTAHGLLGEDIPDNMVYFTRPLDRFFNLSSENNPNVLTEYAKALVFLKSVSTEVTDTKDTWRIALQSSIDTIGQLLYKQASTLSGKISDVVSGFEKVTLQKCFEIMRSDKEDINLEQDIHTLNEYLAVFTKTITSLEAKENVEEFTKPLEKLFYHRDDDVLKKTIKTFMFFQTLNPAIGDSVSWWVRGLTSARNKITESLEKKKADLAKEQRLAAEARAREAFERQRLEMEEKARRDKEEAERIAAEERQRQALEIARQKEETARLVEAFKQQQEEARLAVETAERQRRVELETARLERQEAEQKAAERYQAQMASLTELLQKQQEEAARAKTAREEERRLEREEAERQRLAALAEREERERKAAEQHHTQMAEAARLTELLQKQQEEAARATAAREEERRFEREEAARLAATLQKQQEAARLVIEEAERQRRAELEAARLAQSEADRKAEERYQAQMAEAARLTDLLQKQQEEARKNAEEQRLAGEERERQAMEERRLLLEDIAREQGQERVLKSIREEEAERRRLADLAEQKEKERKVAEQLNTQMVEMTNFVVLLQKQQEERKQLLGEIEFQQRERNRELEEFKEFQKDMRFRKEADDEARQRREDEMRMHQAETVRQVILLQGQLADHRRALNEEKQNSTNIISTLQTQVTLLQKQLEQRPVVIEPEKRGPTAAEIEAARIQTLLSKPQGTIISAAEYNSIPVPQRGAYVITFNHLQKRILGAPPSPPTYRKI